MSDNIPSSPVPAPGVPVQPSLLAGMSGRERIIVLVLVAVLGGGGFASGSVFGGTGAGLEAKVDKLAEAVHAVQLSVAKIETDVRWIRRERRGAGAP